MSPAGRFLNALMAGYPDDDALRLEIRCLAPAHDTDRPRPYPRQWYVPRPDYLSNAAAACEHWGRDWDVYAGVLPRQGRTGSQNDVLYARWLFADVDGGDEGVSGAVMRLKESGVDLPDIAVQSGGGVHAYWLLDAPVPLPDRESRESFKRTLRRLCLAIGGTSPAAHGDPAACEVARILRVPGTWNHKRGREELRPVNILRFAVDNLFVGWNSLYESSQTNKSLCRSYDWWRANLPIEPAAKGPKAQPSTPVYTPAGLVSPGLESWAKRGYPEGKRHHDFVSAAAWPVRDLGLAKADAAALLRVKATNSPGRRVITAEEIEGVVKWA